ncbi:MAG: CDP-alcohol phosphatidyltransferase family protein [Gemmatimonadales bacterium]
MTAPASAKPTEVEELVDEVIHRPLARRVVPLLIPTPITPNQVTLLSALVGISGAVALAVGATRPAWRIPAGLLLFAAVVLDCCDGQLARARKISSTTGAIVDGIADYVVGISLGICGSWYMVTVHGSPWYWLLGLAGIASAAVQSALFDHTKTRYIARVSGGYTEREEDIDTVARNRAAARAEGHLGDVILLWVYEGYSRAQNAALAIPPAADPAAYRAAHADRMRTWTFLGIGTHFAIAYVAMILATWWPGSVRAYFMVCVVPLNLLLAGLMVTEPRTVTA